MNKNLLIALALCATPVMAAPALTLKPAKDDRALTVAAEYTRFNSNPDMTAYGVTLKYDKVLAPMNNGNYWSWNAAFNYSMGSEAAAVRGGEDQDFDTMGIRLGIDANVVTNKNLTVFVGPRVGYTIFEWDKEQVAGESKKEKSIMFGYSAGVRYITNGGTSLEFGYIHGYYNNTKDDNGMSDDTHSIYAGVSFDF